MKFLPEKYGFLLAIAIGSAIAPCAQADGEKPYNPVLPEASRVETYKDTPERPLVINIFDPQPRSDSPAPAIIFFSGGGWVHSTTTQFLKQALFFSKKGYVVLLPDYRVKNRDGTHVAECIEDARDAYRWTLDHCSKLGIDPGGIILAGGSAGGHLALATILLDPGLPIPRAIITFNPVTRTTKGGYYTPGAFSDPANLAAFSLHDKIRGGLPPLLIQHGDSDHTVPPENAIDFAKAWADAGNSVKLVLYPGADHGFFNTGLGYDQTLANAESFLDAVIHNGPFDFTTDFDSPTATNPTNPEKPMNLKTNILAAAAALATATSHAEAPSAGVPAADAATVVGLPVTNVNNQPLDQVLAGRNANDTADFRGVAIFPIDALIKQSGLTQAQLAEGNWELTFNCRDVGKLALRKDVQLAVCFLGVFPGNSFPSDGQYNRTNGKAWITAGSAFQGAAIHETGVMPTGNTDTFTENIKVTLPANSVSSLKDAEPGSVLAIGISYSPESVDLAPLEAFGIKNIRLTVSPR